MSQHEHTEQKEPKEQKIPHCCGSDSACAAEVVVPQVPAKAGAAVYRISTMDCAAEEGEIRHALKDIPGLRSLNFQLGARTIAIDAPAESLPQALEAIRKAGFPRAGRRGNGR